MGLMIKDRTGYWDIDGIFNFPIHSDHVFSRKSTSLMVDPDKYDIIPKESHRKEMLAKKEEEIAALDREWESTKIYYTERRKKLEEEKERMLRKKSLSP